MRVLGGAPRIAAEACVAAVGAFDGVHRGHAALLARLCTLGDALGLPAVVALAPSDAQRRAMQSCLLTPEEERVQRLLGYGIASVVDDLSLLAPAHLASGTPARSQRAGAVSCEQVALHRHAGLPISSTRIRQAVANADMPLAAALLGRPLTVAGQVVEGRRLGRTLGAPTANISLAGRALPLCGVFAAEVRLADDSHPAMAYIGSRPSVREATPGDAPAPVLELHLLDFHGDLYGRTLEAALLAKLRDEQVLPSLDALAACIAENLARTRVYFERR